MFDMDTWRTPASRHVLFVSGPCCTRVEKEAAALRALGWRVDSLSRSQPKSLDAFDQVLTAQYARFPQLIGESGASIVHVHNEPDSLMRWADAGKGGRPVVYDCHDLEWYRYGEVTDDERFAFARADAIVHVSEPHGDVAYSLHPWECPSVVLYSAPLRSRVPTYRGPRHGTVYHGGVQPPGVNRWRDLSAPCVAFAEAGLAFDIFTRPEMGEFYPNVRGYLEYDELLSAISRYAFGFLGSDPASDKFEVAVPNKLWEYAACGVIPAGCNAPAARAAFGGGGLWAESTRALIALMRECDPAEERAKLRPRFMDDEIAKLEALYASL